MSDLPPSRLGVDDPDAVDQAAAVLEAGGTVVLPTDTVYGVAALASNPDGVAKLFELKQRRQQQPLAVLVGDIGQALALVAEPGPAPQRWMAELWPGPLTLVMERCAAAKGLTLGGEPDTIGVRCPDHDFVRAVAARTGPLATTSANRSGQPTATAADEAAEVLAGDVDLVIDGGPAGDLASTVVEVNGEQWQVLRAGAMDPARLR